MNESKQHEHRARALESFGYLFMLQSKREMCAPLIWIDSIVLKAIGVEWTAHGFMADVSLKCLQNLYQWFIQLELPVRITISNKNWHTHDEEELRDVAAFLSLIELRVNCTIAEQEWESKKSLIKPGMSICGRHSKGEAVRKNLKLITVKCQLTALISHTYKVTSRAFPIMIHPSHR